MSIEIWHSRRSYAHVRESSFAVSTRIAEAICREAALTVSDGTACGEAVKNKKTKPKIPPTFL